METRPVFTGSVAVPCVLVGCSRPSNDAVRVSSMGCNAVGVSLVSTNEPAVKLASSHSVSPKVSDPTDEVETGGTVCMSPPSSDRLGCSVYRPGGGGSEQFKDSLAVTQLGRKVRIQTQDAHLSLIHRCLLSTGLGTEGV